MTSTPTILLVEDNPDDAELARLAFRKVRLPVAMVVSADGQEALDYLASAGDGLPALVLLDLKLPRIDGFEVLRRIREVEETRFLPVVVLTTSDEDVDIARSYALGANGYVRKPVDFDAFMRAADTIVAYWLRINLPPPMRGART